MLNMVCVDPIPPFVAESAQSVDVVSPPPSESVAGPADQGTRGIHLGEDIHKIFF